MANREQMDRMYSRFMEQVEEFKAQMQEEADTLGIQQLDLRTSYSLSEPRFLFGSFDTRKEEKAVLEDFCKEQGLV